MNSAGQAGSPAHRPTGRFAPSPTGDLHFGSLLAALASYCEIRSKNGLWQLRIDDIDAPRSVPGSADDIQRTLEQYGFAWDGPVHWQSQHHSRYRDSLARLVSQQRVYRCSCSRRMLPASGLYPGTCRSNTLKSLNEPVQDNALRLILNGKMSLSDKIQGRIVFDLSSDCGDAVIWRRDGLVSYALACAADDGMDVTEVVRGADLLDSSAIQLAIMHYLDLTPPDYAHIPVAIDSNKDKLSKYSKAPAISSLDPLATLKQAWRFLGQAEMLADDLAEFWVRAIANWNMTKVPAQARLQT